MSKRNSRIVSLSRQTLILALLFVLSISVYAQVEGISKEQFNDAFIGFWENKGPHDRRETQRTERLRDGKVVSWEQYVYEGLLPYLFHAGRSHSVEIQSKDGTTKRTEEIKIGDVTYCKTVDEEWKISKGECILGSASGGPSPVTERYSRENVTVDGRQMVLYRDFETYKSRVKGDHRKRFREWKFWLDKSGMLVREERRKGILKGLIVEERTIAAYEWDPQDLKIEAPIKP